MSLLLLAIAVGFVYIVPSGASRLHKEEPQCVSKFDYDYKILQKLLDLEKQQKESMELLTQQQDTIRKLEIHRNNYGTTYTRWGKKTCPGNGTSLVYTGYMGGGFQSHTGSGANYLCLTTEPLWDHYEEATRSGGRMYGVEYRFWEHSDDGAAKFFGQNVFNKNAPCSVCHTTRGSSVMIPGRNECNNGWTKEYSGYLVSGYLSHDKASEFICLDGKVDVLDGNEAHDEENRLYLVDSVCGKSLPCPPYVDNRELTCVVCSF